MLRKGGFSDGDSLTFRFEEHLAGSLDIGKYIKTWCSSSERRPRRDAPVKAAPRGTRGVCLWMREGGRGTGRGTGGWGGNSGIDAAL